MRQYLGTNILTHLRISVIVAYLIAWNVVWFAGIVLGGSATSTTARVFQTGDLIGTALFALAIAQTEPMRRLTLRSRENLPGLARELRVIALITGTMGLGWLASIAVERV